MACPIISAVICTHNRYDILPLAIQSLAEQDIERDMLEILVIDNSGDHQKAEFSKQTYAHLPNLRYVIEAAPGLSNARNIGAHAARGRIVAYIDDDASAATQWAREIISAYDTFANAKAVGGPVRPIWLKPRPAWLTKTAETYFSIIDRGESSRELNPNEWLAGCNLSFDREALISAGGFDVRLGRTGNSSLLSNEETSLVDIIRSRGGAIVYTPGAVVDHRIDPSRFDPSWLKRRIAWQAVSDAISDPNLSREKAAMAAAAHKQRSYIRRAFRLANVFYSRKHVEPDDMQEIYDMVLMLLCKES